MKAENKKMESREENLFALGRYTKRYHTFLRKVKKEKSESLIADTTKLRLRKIILYSIHKTNSQLFTFLTEANNKLRTLCLFMTKS